MDNKCNEYNVTRDYEIMKVYLKLFNDINETQYNSEEREISMRCIFDYTASNIEFVYRKEEFRMIIIRKLLQFYFSKNMLEKETASKYLFLLKILYNKNIKTK